MLRKMQRRFIFYAMSAFFAVILVLLILINGWNYVSVTAQLDETVTAILNLERGDFPATEAVPTPFAFGNPSSEVQYMIRFFALHFDEDGNVSKISMDYIASVSEADAEAYAGEIVGNRRMKGYYQGYRFLVSPGAEESIVVFLNAERELQVMYSIIRLTFIIAGCCLLALFVIVCIFSRRAIDPFVRNIETQKRFITGASHELKTPLTSISMSAEVLALDQAENEWVQNIQLQSRRMSGLIADLITLSRLDEERPYPNQSVFSLSEAAWEIAEPFSVTAKSKGKEYIQRIDEDISMVGDKASIQQMLSVLLDNALKYSDENGKIRFDVKKKAHGAEITVYNTCHIENYNNIDRIFERFYRLETSQTAGNSYGLGLSIAKAVAENHGGTIEAETQQGCNLLIRVIFAAS